MALLSILGIYHRDNTIFDEMKLPEGVNRETLVMNLLSECAELEFIYPSAKSAKTFINSWSNMQIKVWEHLNTLFEMDYNPIWNYDGTDKETETHNLKANGKTVINGSVREDVTGLNSDIFRNDNRSVSDSTTVGESADTGTITRERKRGGNQGTTTTQQMLNEELETRPKLNIYRYIIEDFKHRFCLLIY